VLLDMREPAEVALGAIEGSCGIPLGCLQPRQADVRWDQSVVIYYQSGMRASIAASLLVAAGYSRVVTLAGGFDPWRRHACRAAHMRSGLCRAQQVPSDLVCRLWDIRRGAV
jgi:rhodanese-related sulfurtransferase